MIDPSVKDPKTWPILLKEDMNKWVKFSFLGMRAYLSHLRYETDSMRKEIKNLKEKMK